MEITEEVLKKYKNIALVGASKNLAKTSTVVMKYLQDYGFKVYPVNPSMKGEIILGEKVFGNILEIDGPVEIVDVFRPSNEVAEIAKDAIYKTGAGNIDLLARNAIDFGADIVATADESKFSDLKDLLSGHKVEVCAGRSGILEVSSQQTDWVMSAIVGSAGLLPGIMVKAII